MGKQAKEQEQADRAQNRLKELAEKEGQIVYLLECLVEILADIRNHIKK